MRRTKIIATLGPATDRPEMLEKLFLAGVDVFRLNYSHQNRAEHERRIKEIRRLSRKHNHAVAVIADLQGPKIRIERFKEGKIELREGGSFSINTALGPEDGDERQVGVSYKALAREVKAKDRLLIDDGRLVLEVSAVADNVIRCAVLTGGELSDNKGLNLQGGGLSAAGLTEKDEADLKHAATLKADFIAISFPKDAADIRRARKMMQDCGCKAGVIAKIERAEALDHSEEIIEAADAIMIARGDLGVEIGDAALPPVQKSLIKMARSMDPDCHHRDPDDAIHDQQQDPDPGRGVRCCQRGHRRRRCRHAVRRDQHRPLSRPGRGGHGADLRRGRKTTQRARLRPPH